MTRPTVTIKSATIVTKKAIHILIVKTRRRKRTTTTTITSPVKKVQAIRCDRQGSDKRMEEQ